MKFLILSSLFISSLAFSQQGGVFNYLKILPTTIPSYCSVGDLRTNASTDTLNFCTATNNWAAFQGLLTWTNPLVNTGGTVSILKATSTQNGYLGSADWTTFNNKQSTLSLGTVTETTSSVLTLSSWTNATVGSPTIQVKQATTSQSGYLSNTDWNTFNGKGAGTVTSVTAPVVLTGSTLISVPKATSTQSGYLSSADFATFSSAGSAVTNNYWCGYHINGNQWTTTSATLADPTHSNGTATLTQRQGNGITVSAAASSLPGITFTPAASTSVYLISANFTDFQGAVNGDATFAITDGTTIITTRDLQQTTGAGGSAQYPVSLVGVYVPGTGSAVTVKIQMSASTSTSYIESAGTISPAIEWCLVQIK